MNRGMRVLQTLALPLGYVTVTQCPMDIIQHHGTVVKRKEKFPENKMNGRKRAVKLLLGVDIDEFRPELGIEDGLAAVQAAVTGQKIADGTGKGEIQQAIAAAE